MGFPGGVCYKSYCLNAAGEFAGTPSSLSRSAVLRKFCSGCHRWRDMRTMYRARLGCDVIELYCRTAKVDVPGRKHDPPELFREENGKIRPLTAEESDRLHDRNRYNFSVPRCEYENCAGRGQRMERSGLRLGEIVAFVCRRSKPRHYPFRHSQFGEVVHKLADGYYKWEDTKTGNPRELKSDLPRQRHPRRHPAPPDVMCPDHPDNHLRRKRSAWIDTKTRKLRWQYGPCPLDSPGHPGWTCSSGEKPRPIIPRPKRRWGGQRYRIAQAERDRGRIQYRRLLPELQEIHSFAKIMDSDRLTDSKKSQLIEEHRTEQGFKVLGNYWPDFLELSGVRVAHPKTWTPSGVAETLIAR